MKQTYRVRVSPTLTCIVGPCTSDDLVLTLQTFGYVRVTTCGAKLFTVDVSPIVFERIERFTLG